MKSLNDYTDTSTSKLFADNGAFFAFSNKQFEEKKQEGVTYVSMNSGLICPKENAKTMMTEFERIFDNAVKQQVKDFGAEAIIRYEYFNHETQLTGDVEQVIDVLSTHRELFPELFSADAILTICQQCYKDAVKNDWF